jgi:hypothetical protein
MCAQRFGKWLFVVSVMLAVTACQPTRMMSAPPTPRPTIVPIAMFEVTPVSTSTPVPTPAKETVSGVVLTASISPMCAAPAQPNAECVRPYTGEFVITELNGAEVTRVITSQNGQAMVNLPPGKYILGVRTEDIYPLAAPVKVNVLADQYASVSLNLNSGLMP